MEPPSTPHPTAPPPSERGRDSQTPPAGVSRRPRLSLRMDVAARTDPGLERGTNQDSYFVIEPGEGASSRRHAEPAWAAIAVCDGMGGAAGGDVASQLAVDVLRDAMLAGGAPATRDALGRRVLHGVQEAARRVFAAARSNRRLDGMGTTATACAITGDTMYLAQVGDSRAYLFRGGALTQLTRDQTLATLMMEQGQLAPEDVSTFPYGHVILQAVGTSERVDVDLTRVQLAAGDVVLVCSDGLHGPVPHDAIRAVLEGEPTPADACDALVDLAIAAGAPDNVTVVVARVEGDTLPRPKAPPLPEKARLDEDATEQVAAIAAPAEPAGPTTRSAATGKESKAEVRSPAAAARADRQDVSGAIARIAAFFRRRRGGTSG